MRPHLSDRLGFPIERPRIASVRRAMVADRRLSCCSELGTARRRPRPIEGLPYRQRGANATAETSGSPGHLAAKGGAKTGSWRGSFRRKSGALSLLARRTRKRRTPALDDAGDRPVAAAARAGGAFAVVDGEGMLEIAELAVGLTVVAQRRAAGFDGFLQHVADRRGQRARCGGRPALGVGEQRSGSGRADARAVQRLADIDVAQSGDALLVEQRGFDWRARAGEQRGELGGVEFRRQRFDAHLGERRPLVDPFALPPGPSSRSAAGVGGRAG